MALISAMIIAISEITLNNIFNETLTSFVESYQNYEFPNQFYSMDASYISFPMFILFKNIKMTGLSVSDYEINYLEPNAIDITIDNINFVLEFSWEYVNSHVSDSGKGKIKVTSMAVFLETVLSNANTIQISPGDIQVNIPNLDVSLVQPNSVNSDWVFKMFKKDIGDYISRYIINTLNSTISAYDAGDMYGVIAGYDIAFNYSLSKPLYVFPDLIQAESLGIFIQPSAPNYNPPIPTGSLPVTSGIEGIQMVLTDYTANSLSYTAHKGNYLNINISNSNLPPDFPFPLTTTTVALIIPGIVQTYGFNKDINVTCSFKEPPVVRFLNTTEFNADVSINGYMQCGVYIETVKAFLFGLQLSGGARLYLDNWKLKGQISRAEVEKIDVIESSMDIDTLTLKNTVNAALTAYIASLNSAYLDNGILLPESTRFNLTETKIMTGDGYLYLLSRPKVTIRLEDFYNINN
jgi:LBP / BPI / CETP family, C-terminal domain